jgi:hypothetical protein
VTALVTPRALAWLLCGAAGAAGAQAAPQPVGWAFRYGIVASAAGRPLENGTVQMDVAIWHGIARITVRSGPLRAIAGDNGTILVRSQDSSVVVLNPARREALVATPDELGALLGGAAAGMQVAVSDVTSVTRPRGSGPTTAGFATQRVELEQQYTLEVKAATAKRSIHTAQRVQLDVSRPVQRLDPGFRAFAQHFARSLGVPGPVRAQLRAAERRVPDGFPLHITTSAVTVAGTDSLRTESEATVTAFRTEAVDTATFLVPAGYRITEMRRLLQPRGRAPASSPPPSRSP